MRRWFRPILPLLAAAAALLATHTVGVRADEPALRDYRSSGAELSSNFALMGYRWEAPTIAVYRNFDGGQCLLAGVETVDDLSGPASSHVSKAEVEAALSQALLDLNAALQGRLVLVDGGEVSREALCTHDPARPIVVGFGALEPPSIGQTLGVIFVDREGPFNDPHSMRVFIANDSPFQCPADSSREQLRTVILHELLHAVGLDHSEVASAVMYFESDVCGAATSLHPDDLAALDALYGPAPSPPPPPDPIVEQPGPTGPLTVAPNGPYLAGANGVVVQGGGPASAVATTVSAQSGRPVLAIWALSSGSWRFYLPATPGVDGGLASFPQLSSAIVVLA